MPRFGGGDVPTADEYRAGARRFRSMAEQLAREAGAHRAIDPSAFLGRGPVGVSVGRSLTTIHSSLGDAAHRLVALAAECDRRAEVCDAYRRAIDRHRSLPFVERATASEPRRPAHWVEG